MFRAAVVGSILMMSMSLASAPAAQESRDPFTGAYRGDKLAVELAPFSTGEYAGTIHLGQQQFPLRAREADGTLTGTFLASSGEFEFSAERHGDTLVLISGGKTYTMTRLAENPLARAGGAPAAAPALGGYTLALSNDSGKVYTAAKPDVASVHAALESTFPDLARYFDARPMLQGAFEDAKDHRAGGASFTAKLKGQAVKGFVSVKVQDKGATVAVAYCRADAPTADWLTLVSATTASATSTGAAVSLKGYRFPDGTGTIGVADGWHTNSQSCTQTVTVQGPAGQTVMIGFTLSVVTPDSIAVQTQRQLEANARRMGLPPPPPMQLLVAPYAAPADALADLLPQLSAISQRNGGPALRLERIIDQQKATPLIPNASAALMTYDVSRTERGVSTPLRAAAQIETVPVGQGAWMFYAIELAAPRDTFDRDLPVMYAIVKSLKADDQMVALRTREKIDAQNRNFAAMQQAHREQSAAFDRYNESWRRRQNIQDRSFADFDEVIRGYRTVEDTRTGEHTSVDLGNVHDVVDKLNQRDPGRYKEIPLRDEMYPKVPAPQP